MSTEHELKIRLKADGSGLVTEFKVGEQSVDKFGKTVDSTGASASRASTKLDELGSAVTETKSEAAAFATEARNATRTVEQLSSELNQGGIAAKESAAAIAHLGNQNSSLSNSTGQSSRAVQLMVDSLEREAAMLGMTARERDVYVAKLHGATAAQLQAINASHDTIQQFSKGATGSFRNVGSAATQLGFQIQDVAVQAQYGASMFTILGQQGSQILSIFGMWGGIAGAVLAVGAAFASVVAKAGQTGSSLDELRTEARDLAQEFSISETGLLTYNDRLQRLADTAPSVADALFRIKKQQLELEQSMTASAIGADLSRFRDLAVEFGSHATMSFEQAKTSALFLMEDLSELAQEFGGTNDNVMRVAQAVEEFQRAASKDTAQTLVASLEALKGGSDEARASLAQVIGLLARYIETEQALSTNDPAVTKTKNIQSMVEALELEAATLGNTSRARDLYIATLNKATQEQKDAINAAYDAIEADQNKASIDGLRQRLMTEQELLDDNYVKTREKIISATEGNHAARMELLGRHIDQYQQAWLSMEDRNYQNDSARQQEDALREELRVIEQYASSAEQIETARYQQQLQIMRDARAAGIESIKGYDELEKQLATQHAQALTEIQTQKENERIQADNAKRQKEDQDAADRRYLEIAAAEGRIEANYSLEDADRIRREVEEQEHQDRLRSIRLKHAGEYGDIVEQFVDMDRASGADRVSIALDIGEKMFGAAAGESKKAFELQKAFRIGQAVVSAYTAITNAMADLPYPANIAASVAIGVQAFANIRKIQSQKFEGGRMFGGGVSAQGFVEVGEHNRPELFKQDGKLLLFPGNRGGQVIPLGGAGPAVASGVGQTSPQVVVNLFNAPPGAEVRQNGNQVDVIWPQVQDRLAQDMVSGADWVKAGESTYGWNRATGSRVRR